MRKITLILIISLLFSALTIAADYLTLKNADEPFTVQVIQSDRDHTLIQYSVNGFATDEVVIDGKTYTIITKLRKESMIEDDMGGTKRTE